MFPFQFLCKSLQVIFQEMDLIDVRINLHHGEKSFLHGKMNLGTRDLLLKTADYRRCQNDIANRAEPYDEDLFQGRFFTKVRLRL